MNYVVGFAFCGDQVALIEKTRPAWQAGKLNGIGGKIEPGELSDTAMAREFREETGVLVESSRWYQRVYLKGSGFGVEVFMAELSDSEFNALRTTTEETVLRFHRNCIPWDRAVPNLKWLIPLCQCESGVRFPVDIPYGDDEAKK